MREIEFRGKSVISGKWVYGWLNATTEEDGEHYWIDKCLCAEEGTDYSYQVDPETIGQYTGLKDKNGKKIFEGDIVKTGYYDDGMIVEWDNDWCAFQPLFDARPIEAFPILSKTDNIEVIGNIYDNPELWKEQRVQIIKEILEGLKQLKAQIDLEESDVKD